MGKMSTERDGEYIKEIEWTSRQQVDLFSPKEQIYGFDLSMKSFISHVFDLSGALFTSIGGSSQLRLTPVQNKVNDPNKEFHSSPVAEIYDSLWYLRLIAFSFNRPTEDGRKCS